MRGDHRPGIAGFAAGVNRAACPLAAKEDDVPWAEQPLEIPQSRRRRGCVGLHELESPDSEERRDQDFFLGFNACQSASDISGPMKLNWPAP